MPRSKAAATVTNGSPALVAIVIPLYGHAALAFEALESVRTSVGSCRLGVVVSVDGDPRREVFDQLALYAAVWPDLHVIFGPNGGPGAARNRAIDYVLEKLPKAAAVYFLDADNRLLPHTIETLYRHLVTQRVGWVYTNIDTFAVTWRGHQGDAYSRLTHCVADNICDTGSIIAIDILRAGIRFNEDRQNGFEDWDFWLSCIEAGFVGAPCRDAGFEYRLRAESRFKEANRDRTASIRFLRRQHKNLFRRPTLVGFEHEECPRYAFVRTGDGTVAFLTDPTRPPQALNLDQAITAFWGSIGEPDNIHFPPFLAACSSETWQLLERSRMLPGILCHLERLSESANIVFVQLGNAGADRSISHELHPSGALPARASELVFVATALVHDAIQNDALDWLTSLVGPQVWPTSATLQVRFPFPRAMSARSFVMPEQALVNVVRAIATSPLKESARKRWTWRPPKLPARAQMFRSLREELDGGPVLPLAHNKAGRRTLALLVPIASFGGAEKVAFAAARELRGMGFETHLFVLGTARMDVVDEFDAVFDFIHFWYSGVPVWDASDQFLGQDFIAESHRADWSALKGLLSGFDLVINNHVMVAHSLMAKLRAEGTRTACYLHVVDETEFGRSAGQPYAAIAHEHCYDAFLTCSEQLKVYLHSFGVPLEKVFAVPNGPGFSVEPARLADLTARRTRGRRAAALRVLYMGRLDRQKGIDRLYEAIGNLRERGVPCEVRAVGGEILSDSRVSWADRLRALGVDVRPPVFGSRDLAQTLAWGDVLVMPSRWEGAPLMIAEAQMLGCVPVAVSVGAVDELITDGRDGIVVPDRSDGDTIAGFVDAIATLADDGETLSRLARNCMQTANDRSWAASFSMFLAWCDASVTSASGSQPKPLPTEAQTASAQLESAFA